MRMVFVLRQQARFAGRGHLHIHDKHRQDVSFARIKAAFKNLHIQNFGGRYAQSFRCRLAQRLQRMGRRHAILRAFARRIGSAGRMHRQCAQGKFDFSDADHGARSYQADANDTGSPKAGARWPQRAKKSPRRGGLKSRLGNPLWERVSF